MKLVRSQSLLQLILNKHLIEPITYIYLTYSEFQEVLAEAIKNKIYDFGDEYEIRLKNCDIAFYLEN